MSRWPVFMALCLALICAGTPPSRAAAEPAGLSGIAVTGYTLWTYAPPGWHWAPAPAPAPVATARSAPDGSTVLTFTLPLASLPGLDPRRFRFGLAKGFIAGGPITWLSPGEELRAAAGASPTEGPVFGQAPLSRAIVTAEAGVLRAELTFPFAPALETPWDLMGLVDADGSADTGYRGAEWLLQNCPLGAGPAPGLKVPWLEARPGILRPRETITLTAWVLNDGPERLEGVASSLGLPAGVQARPADAPAAFGLAVGEARRLTWTLSADQPGLEALRLTVTAGERAVRRTRWITVVRARDPRREYQAQTGDWLPYPPRPALQEGNSAPLARVEPLPSARLKRNLFGITAHLPRSVNDEDPFLPGNALDGDPATCWASRWWRVAVPFEPEWLQVDLGAAGWMAGVQLLPAWHNGGFPAAFRLEVSGDGRRWEAVAERFDYKLQAAPEGSPLRDGEVSWQAFSFEPRRARFLRLSATRLTQGATSFFCAPYEPFQLRLAEVRIMGRGGEVLRPVAATASSVHQAWFNTPETTTRTWPLLLQSGVKLNRVNQWGDRLDWASVEREKGVYHIPPEADRALAESHAAGVETLLTLDYGNNLYQQVKSAPDFGPTWRRGHPFLQCAPTTPEAVAAFARYCGFMVGHFRGRVRYFEVWNEENGWFFDDWATGGSLAQVRAYGRALKAAAQAIKQANPEAVVVFGGTAGSTLDYPRLALEEGAGPWVDVFAFHPYGHPTPERAPDSFLCAVGDHMEWRPRPEGIRTYEEEIAAMRRLLRRFNPKMQVWADEMNWFAPGEPPDAGQGDQSELTQAKHLARFYAMNAWMGCGAVWWSLYNANGVQEWAVVRSADMTPRAAYYAAQYTATVLDDVRAARNVRPQVVGPAPADLVVKAFRTGEGATLVGLWRSSFGEDSCKPTPVTVRLRVPGATSCELVDLLYGLRQPARTRRQGDDLVIPQALVGDWPLVVRLQ